MSDNKNYGQSFGQSLLGGIVGNVLGVATNEWQNQRNHERQVQAQKDAESRQNLEWWKRQQHLENYQSPANMAKLIREAGGNPLALFSQGYSPNPANPVSPGLSSPNIGSTTANPVLDPLTTAEIDLMKAQAEKLRSDIDVNTSNISLNAAYEDFTKQQTLSEEQLTRLRTLEADIQEATKGTQIQTYITALEKMQAEVRGIDQNTEYYRQLSFQVELARAVEQYKLDNILPAELANIESDTAYNWKQVDLSNQEIQRLRDLSSQDKHQLYLNYQTFMKEYGSIEGEYYTNLSERDFDDFIMYNLAYMGDDDNSLQSRRISANERLAGAQSTNAAVNAGTTTAIGLAVGMASLGKGWTKKIGEKLIKNATQHTIVK